ncbi:hypothetical protein DS832_01510 [Bombilactobacillus bombi]|uniref:Uncharacterized protein n=1 Tax=Bombilactobacillus bombi TaxID=1303590 RepID=A0A417ZCB0_9LACO|nr:hypothetical protein [Bombilactobacillus bombi]RHW48269.1 hypothetical protein DS832_01510 [Bombilactobacillus bombi]
MNKTKNIILTSLTSISLLTLGMPLLNTNPSPISISVVQAKTKSHKETKLEASRKDLKTIISMPMEKENYLNLEKWLMESARYNDIEDPSNTAAQRKFDIRLKNIKRINKQTSKMYTKSDIKVLTNSDYKLLKKYKKSLKSYLSDLYDYAVEYQEAMPVINNPKTQDNTKQQSQSELDKYKKSFDKSKTKWQNNYDQIMNLPDK